MSFRRILRQRVFFRTNFPGVSKVTQLSSEQLIKLLQFVEWGFHGEPITFEMIASLPTGDELRTYFESIYPYNKQTHRVIYQLVYYSDPRILSTLPQPKAKQDYDDIEADKFLEGPSRPRIFPRDEDRPASKAAKTKKA